MKKFRNSNEITDEQITALRKKVLDKLGMTTESEKYSEARETLDGLEVAASDLVYGVEKKLNEDGWFVYNNIAASFDGSEFKIFGDDIKTCL